VERNARSRVGEDKPREKGRERERERERGRFRYSGKSGAFVYRGLSGIDGVVIRITVRDEETVPLRFSLNRLAASWILRSLRPSSSAGPAVEIKGISFNWP